jgi:hypothetical protein
MFTLKRNLIDVLNLRNENSNFTEDKAVMGGGEELVAWFGLNVTSLALL